MIKTLWPYFYLLEQQTEEMMVENETALACWHEYEFYTENKIVIPDEYATILNELINVFSQETFPNSAAKWGYGQLSEETEGALKDFFNRLLPEGPTRLDEHLDPELLLYAAYSGYENHFRRFKNWDQRDAFCIRVIGLVQSVLSPESAEIFCEGLKNVIENRIKISVNAVALKLSGGESYYRSSRESVSGLGFRYLIGEGRWGAVSLGRHCSRGAWPSLTLGGALNAEELWESHVKQKLTTYSTYAVAHPKSEVVCNFKK
jgi:hypothetical protein